MWLCACLFVYTYRRVCAYICVGVYIIVCVSASVSSCSCDHICYLISVCVIAYAFKTPSSLHIYLISFFFPTPLLNYFLPVEQAAAVSTIRATKDIQAAYAVPFDVNGKHACVLVSLFFFYFFPPCLMRFELNISQTIFLSSPPPPHCVSFFPAVSLTPSSSSPSPSLSGVEGVALQTEGVNFEAIWAMSSKLVQANQIKCNDIWRMLTTFGIESARASIVTEVQGELAVDNDLFVCNTSLSFGLI
jgi:RNA polymerase Rpb1, domain 5